MGLSTLNRTTSWSVQTCACSHSAVILTQIENKSSAFGSGSPSDWRSARSAAASSDLTDSLRQLMAQLILFSVDLTGSSNTGRRLAATFRLCC